MDANFILIQVEWLHSALNKEHSQDSSEPSEAFKQIAYECIQRLFKYLHPEHVAADIPQMYDDDGNMDIPRVANAIQEFHRLVGDAYKKPSIATKAEEKAFRALVRKELGRLYTLIFPKGKVAQLQVQLYEANRQLEVERARREVMEAGADAVKAAIAQRQAGMQSTGTLALWKGPWGSFPCRGCPNSNWDPKKNACNAYLAWNVASPKEVEGEDTFGTGPNGQSEKVCELSKQGYWVPRCPFCHEPPEEDDPQQLNHHCKDFGFSGSVQEWYSHVALHVSCKYCGKRPERCGPRGVRHECELGRMRGGVAPRYWIEENWPGLAWFPFAPQEMVEKEQKANPHGDGPDDFPFLTQAHPTYPVLTYGDVWDRAIKTCCKVCNGLPNYNPKERAHGDLTHRCIDSMNVPGVDFEGDAGEWLQMVEEMPVVDKDVPQGVKEETPRCPACDQEVQMEMRPYVIHVDGERVRRTELIIRHNNKEKGCHFVGKPDQWLEFVQHYKNNPPPQSKDTAYIALPSNPVEEEGSERDLFRSMDLVHECSQRDMHRGDLDGDEEDAEPDFHQETAQKIVEGSPSVAPGKRSRASTEAFHRAYGIYPAAASAQRGLLDGVVPPGMHFIRTETGRMSAEEKNKANAPRGSRATPIRSNLPRRRKPKIVGNIVLREVLQKLVDKKHLSHEDAAKVEKGFADEVQARIDAGKPHTHEEERAWLDNPPKGVPREKPKPVIRDYVDEGGLGVHPLGRAQRYFGFSGDLPSEMIHKLREQLDALEKEVRGDERRLNLRVALTRLEKDVQNIKESQLSMMWKRIQWLEGKVGRTGEGTWATLLDIMKRHGLRAPLSLLRIYDMYDS